MVGIIDFSPPRCEEAIKPIPPSTEQTKAEKVFEESRKEIKNNCEISICCCHSISCCQFEPISCCCGCCKIPCSIL